MAEKKIELFEIDPIDIFGVNDRLINRLANYYPKLKVVPRGNTISLKGTAKDIFQFISNLNIHEINKKAAPYKKVQIVKIRNEEFEKNTSRKITRFSIDKTID